MKLEERLTTHFDQITEAMPSPPLRPEPVMQAGAGRGPVGWATVGVAIAAAGVIVAAMIGLSPNDVEHRESELPRRIVSPYIQIESQLAEADLELFTVTTDHPEYWRIAGLDAYEDDLWKVAGDFSPQNGQLPRQDVGGDRREVLQEFRILNLGTIWLPAASTPTEIVESSATITWNPETDSLTVDMDTETSNGVDYTIISQVPEYDVEDLRTAPDVIPEDVAARNLAVPSDLPEELVALANELTADEPTRYDKMLALQNHFQGYEYSLDLSPRDGDVISQFLRERRGFSQQFSGTFALMARTIGVPARVAVGFTWGDPVDEPDPETGRQTFTVSTRHAHAWPEVYFDGLGWVAFEPTPGRGSPSLAGYTGVSPTQPSGEAP